MNNRIDTIDETDFKELMEQNPTLGDVILWLRRKFNPSIIFDGKDIDYVKNKYSMTDLYGKDDIKYEYNVDDIFHADEVARRYKPEDLYSMDELSMAIARLEKAALKKSNKERS